ncbi:MAG: GH51 [uncultured Thermomicrobiales bacterium]|uniref:non-reducing end alpha-L-arabinofuranosidase n=1 Tax=uncultured Thermomicrobiales bacterium TaxID=1645740 RepID=A0A6J4V198_9BACT|nr:MAG: GH51 [uncultured Thermomicrobiales bacterium]
MAATIDILLDEPIATIDPNVYGHFAEHLGECIYDGVWTGEGEAGRLVEGVVAALRRVRPAVLRWPGGCFADDYHWQDGIGPVANRPRRINIHWGEVVESNEFGTHEFVRLCRAIGAAPYFCGNVGSGSPRELRDWVEYCNFPGDTAWSALRAANGDPEPFNIHYWGVGNESWGCGGNFTPEEYAAHYRRFSTYLRDFGGDPPYLIACGPNRNDLDWTERFFTKLHEGRGFGRIHGYAPHYYTSNRDGHAGTDTAYTDDQWYALLAQATEMEALIVGQRAVMDRFDPERKIGMIIDEWGTWHPPTPGRNPRFLWQQNTLRDALVAALSLDIFGRHADTVVMANIAQTVNVLQALLLTEGERVITTPTYHVYDLYAPHQGAQALRVAIDAPTIGFAAPGGAGALAALTGSASLRDRILTLTVVNPGIGAPVEATITPRGAAVSGAIEETVLTHDDIHAHNTFDAPDTVTLSAPRAVTASGGTFTHTFASQSVTRLTIPLR